MKAKQKIQLKKVGMSFAFAGSIVIASPAISEASSTFGDQLLYEGKKDEDKDGNGDVGQLQKLLGEHGFLSEYMDTDTEGLYDQETREAVTDFQAEHDLLVDGIAGPQTIGALSILQYGDEGKVVSELQEDLQNLGHYDFKVDGIFGPITEEAVKDFQREHDIAVDGLAGPETFGTIHEVKQEKLAGASKSKKKSASGSDDSDSDQSGGNDHSNDSKDDSKDNEPETAKEDSAAHYGANNSEDREGEDEEVSSETSSENESNKTNDDSQAASTEAGSTHEFQAEATAYTAYCAGCSGTTATGLDLRNNPNKKVIAVDPDVIPLGSTVEVEGYGTAIAADTGGAIKGHKIDVFIPNREEALSWGRQTVKVRVLD